MKNYVSSRFTSKTAITFLVAAMTTVGIIFSAGIVAPVFAHEEECTPTLETLPECVTHHWLDGEIYSKGVYKNLLSLANAAVDARDQGDAEEVLELLEEFIETVEANTPKKISDEAAEHMIHHATEAMAALESSA